MPNLRTLIAAGILTLVAALLTGVSPASAAGSYKCDTNSPQWNVTMCVRTEAIHQGDGSGWKMDYVRVWATGNPDTLESCPAFVARVYLKRQDGDIISWFSGSGCEAFDYSTKVDFYDVKFGDDAVVVVYVQMYDNGAVDPPVAKITLPAVAP